MKYFVFRNTTVEPFFLNIQNMEAVFSGYEDISVIDESADRYIWFYLFPVEAGSVIAEKMRFYEDLLRIVCKSIPSNKLFILFTIRILYSVKSVSGDRSIEDAVYKYNKMLYDTALKYENIKVIDFACFLEQYGGTDIIDWKYYFISQISISPRLIPAFKEWFEFQMRSVELRRSKCLVLDLDNTLWGGVLGEDGIEGISLGGNYPGNAFSFFQRQILNLSRQGVILVVCSKNNIEDVRELWSAHPEIVLKEKDFSAIYINWNNKADNIRCISEELNIGLDSMVFVDDSPVERELVKQSLPQVIAPDFPEQPYMLPSFFRKLAESYFSVYALTEEDKLKNEQYKASALRDKEKQNFNDIREYIKNLDIALCIENLTSISLIRAAQMTQKTNQFNLTTRRLTEIEIKNMLAEGYKMWTLQVSDKFGDNGITGLCIVKTDGNGAFIDSFLLSCRILGKGIESAFLFYVLRLLKEDGIEIVRSYYIPSAKNMQTRDFYERSGFHLEKEDDAGIKYYCLYLSKTEIKLPEDYKYS